MATVDLNADMGESYGPWKMGNDDILLDIVTSANIAVDFMRRSKYHVKHHEDGRGKDVGIGAHPGFHDIGVWPKSFVHSNWHLAKPGALSGGCGTGYGARSGTTVRHIKLHGAMSNMASEIQHGLCLYDAALSVRQRRQLWFGSHSAPRGCGKIRMQMGWRNFCRSCV